MTPIPRATEEESWQELMGTDLLLKIITSTELSQPQHPTTPHDTSSHPDSHATTTTTTTTTSVQLHDIVVIDWIGYYCNDATQRLLNIPTSTSKDDDDMNAKSSSTSVSSIQPLLDTLPIFHAVENYYCCIGDQDVIPAVEMGLRFMNLNIKRTMTMSTNTVQPTPTPTDQPSVAKDDGVYNTDDQIDDLTLLIEANAATTTTAITPTVALIYSHSKYAYGLSSRTYTNATNTTDGTHRTTTTYTLPPLSNVLYKVTLKRIISSSDNDMSDPKLLLQLYQCKKLLANDIYQNDIRTKSKHLNVDSQIPTNYTDSNNSDSSSGSNATNTYHLHRAIRIYQRTVEKLENLIIELQQRQLNILVPEPNESNATNDANDAIVSYIHEARQIQIDCLNNISAVYMKCHLYHKAKEACVQALLKDSNNSKALFRAAKAALYDPASSYDEVQATLRAVQELVHTQQPQSVELKKDLELLQKEYQQHEMKYKQQQKIMAARIQTKMNPKPAKLKTTTTTTNDSNKENVHNNNKNEDDPDVNHIVTRSKTVTTHDKSQNCNAVPDGQSSTLSFLRKIVSPSNTKRIFYRMVQISLLLFLLLYMYIYFYVMKATVTTTTTTYSSTSPPPQEL